MKKWLSSVFKTYFINFFPLIVVFTASLFVSNDSDLGWHLKYGEYFFQHGQILRTNIFSVEMGGFHWVNSSWATDLFTYAVFRNFGFLGLSILGALVITGIFYFLAKVARLGFWEKGLMFPILLYLEKPLFDVSFRGQLLSLLFISILYFLLSKFEEGKRHWLWTAIPLFVLWSNLHGQFLLGLGLFALWIACYLIQEKNHILREGKLLVSIFILSLSATFLNPFTIGIYQESLKHFDNPLIRYIIEWTPFDRFTLLWWNMIFWEVVILISLGIIIYRKQFRQNLHWIVPTVILLVLSVNVRRYMWSLLLISIPVTKVFFVSLKPKLKDVSLTIASFILIIFYIHNISYIAPEENVLSMNWDRYCYQYVKCSPKSAEFLAEQKYQGKMMTFYNWGGWLISQYPEIKPSIDGRMHLWQDNNGYSAFKEYYPYEQNWKDIDASDYEVVYMAPKKPVHMRLIELVKEGKWKLAYQDDFASIFIRNDKKKQNL